MTANVGKVKTKLKGQAIHERLAALAVSLGPEARLPTVATLCESLDVSSRTLNFALRDLESQGVITRRNGIGLFVSPTVHQHVARRLALVCNGHLFQSANHSPFWDLLLEESKSRAAQYNEVFETHLIGGASNNSEEMPPALMDAVIDGRISAALGILTPDSTACWLEKNGVPMVSFGGGGRVMVTVDMSELCRRAAAYLVGKGCRRIALWRPVADRTVHSTPQYDIVMHDFYTPLKNSIEQCGGIFDAQLIQDNLALVANGKVTLLSGQEQGYATAMRVFSNAGPHPDGIIITDDMMASGALVALRNLGIEPGRDVQVVSHANANSPVLVGYEQLIARVVFDPREIAQKMFSLLDTILQGEDFGPRVQRVAPHGPQ
jgi:DNA-binding LacI/PurR family transcriptional regulator